MRARLAAAILAFGGLIATGVTAIEPRCSGDLLADELATATGAAHELDLRGIGMPVAGRNETLQVRYKADFLGLGLGTIDLTSGVDEDHYFVMTVLSTAGLADVFSSIHFQAIATGNLQGHLVVPQTYNSDSTSRKKRQLVGLVFAEHAPSSVDFIPIHDFTRFPVAPELKRDTVDPVSAALFIITGSSVDGQNKCGGIVPIFDGSRRYNLRLSFTRDVAIANGPDGFDSGRPVQALMCRVEYERVAGFKPPRPGHSVSDLPPIDVWLAPVPGTDFMVPVRIRARLKLGDIVVRAERVTVLRNGSPL
jgi:hypothetical protein